MPNEKILVVEDEEDIQMLLNYNFSKEGYTVLTALTGEEAIEMAESNIPDLIILDLMLPGIDGLEVCQKIKSNPKTRQIPIIMLTARGEENDITFGLELGADDYVTKPFSLSILMARVKAVLRRVPSKSSDLHESVRIGALTIHPGKHEVKIGEKKLPLTFTEFKILHFLSNKPGWVYSRYQIVDATRGEDYPVTERSVDVHIATLRKKLGKFENYIETVRGIGYRFKEDI